LAQTGRDGSLPFDSLVEQPDDHFGICANLLDAACGWPRRRDGHLEVRHCVQLHQQGLAAEASMALPEKPTPHV